MQRLISILPLSFLIFIIAILITIAVDSYIEVPLINFQTFTNTVTIISSTLLLAIGFKLYKKFSSTQSIIDKQTSQVIHLTVMLAEAKFDLTQVHTNGKRGNSIMNITIHGYKTHLKKCYGLIPESDYSEKKLYIDTNMFSFLEHFWKLKYDAYLPKRIALLLRDDFGMMTQASFSKNELKEEHLELRPIFGKKSDTLLWKPSDINKIMKSMKTVYDECNKWLKEYNPEAYESLNLVSDRMPNIKD